MPKGKHIKGFEGIFLVDPPDEPTFTGPPHCLGQKLELSKKGLREMWQRMKGLPVRTEHYYVDIGKVTHVWFKDGKAYCRFYLEDEPWVKDTLDLVKSGKFRSLSLKHDPETYIPLEMTLCETPARQGCVLTKVPVDTLSSSSSSIENEDEEEEDKKKQSETEKNPELYKETQSQYGQVGTTMQQPVPVAPQQQQRPLVAAAVQRIPAEIVYQAAANGQPVTFANSTAEQLLPTNPGGMGFAVGDMNAPGQYQQQQHQHQPPPQQQQQQQQQPPQQQQQQQQQQQTKNKRTRDEDSEEDDEADEEDDSGNKAKRSSRSKKDKEKDKEKEKEKHRARAAVDVQRVIRELHENGKISGKEASRAKKAIKDLKNSAKTAQKEHEEMKNALIKTQAQQFNMLGKFAESMGKKFTERDRQDFQELVACREGRRWFNGGHQVLVAASQKALERSRHHWSGSDSDDASDSDSDSVSSLNSDSGSDVDSDSDTEDDGRGRHHHRGSTSKKDHQKKKATEKLRDTGDSSYHRKKEKKREKEREKDKEKRKKKKQKGGDDKDQTQPQTAQSGATTTSMPPPASLPNAPLPPGLVSASGNALQNTLRDLIGTEDIDALPEYQANQPEAQVETGGFWGAAPTDLLGGGGGAAGKISSSSSSSSSTSSYMPGQPAQLPRARQESRPLVAASGNSAEQQSRAMGWQNKLSSNPMLLALAGPNAPLCLA